MSTLLQFVPSVTTPFTFSPTLVAPDGTSTQYNAAVLYNVFGQRYYLTLTDLAGNPITCTPVVGSGPQLQASFTWNEQTGTAVIATTLNHNVPVGSEAQITVADTDSAFDGDWLVLSTGAQSLSYPLLTDPEIPLPASGLCEFNINLLAGLGIGTLLYYSQTLQFSY